MRVCVLVCVAMLVLMQLILIALFLLLLSLACSGLTLPPSLIHSLPLTHFLSLSHSGLLPVPIIASSAGPITLADVASLAVSAARSQVCVCGSGVDAHISTAGVLRSM